MISEYAGLVDRLSASGVLPSAWRQAFERVPRELFIPDLVWVDGKPRSRTADPQAWTDLVYSDEPIVTQVNDGAFDGLGSQSTSSSSMPSIMATMLDRLDVAAGHRILEIGTGTGWNTALLAARLGDQNVTTVEIDGGLADRARRALANAGFSPSVITADGAYGYSLGAPYDRVLATAAVTRVPYPWVAQAPSGRVVAPWGTEYHNGTLLTLDVGSDGVASGRFGGNLAFMRLRDQRIACDLNDGTDDDTDESATAINVYEVVGDFDGSFAVGLRMPGSHHILDTDPDDEYRHVVRVHHPASGSWARVRIEPGLPAYRVHQHGPLRLWDQVEAAHARWVEHGRPAHTRFGLTVTPDTQYAWLDSPGCRY